MRPSCNRRGSVLASNIMGRLPPKHACRFCGQKLDVHHVRRGFCRESACVAKHRAIWSRKRYEERERTRTRLVKELNEGAEAWRDQAAQSVGFPPQQTLPLVLVYGTSSPCVPVEEKRRQALAQHLAQLVEKADSDVSTDEPVPSAAPRKSPLPSACALCRGRCCDQGADTGFIDVDLLRRQVERNPEQTLHEVVTDYLQRVPDEVIAGSCIFHTQNGCVLPSEMRADICNTFICEGLSKADPESVASGVCIVVGVQYRPTRGMVIIDGVEQLRADDLVGTKSSCAEEPDGSQAPVEAAPCSLDAEATN